jgi:hypothetical protein
VCQAEQVPLISSGKNHFQEQIISVLYFQLNRSDPTNPPSKYNYTWFVPVQFMADISPPQNTLLNVTHNSSNGHVEVKWEIIIFYFFLVPFILLRQRILRAAIATGHKDAIAVAKDQFQLQSGLMSQQTCKSLFILAQVMLNEDYNHSARCVPVPNKPKQMVSLKFAPEV